MIRQFSGRVPILGICLGHQAIGEVFGGNVIPAEELMHGKMSKIFIKNTDPLFDGLEEKNLCGKIPFSCSRCEKYARLSGSPGNR